MGLFVIFHIVRYSVKRNLAFFGVTLFVSVFFLLLISNYLLFFSLPLNELTTNLSF